MGKADVDAVEIASKQRHLHLLTKVKQGQPLTKMELEELAGYEKKSKAKKGGGKETLAGIAPEQIVEGSGEAAKYAGVSTRTIRRWAVEGMFVGKRNGKKIYIKNVLDVFKLHQGKELSQDRKREQTAEADYKEIKAKLLAMDLKVRTGELIECEEIEKQRVERILTVTRGLNAMQRRIIVAVPTTCRKQVKKILDREIKYLRKIFAGDHP